MHHALVAAFVAPDAVAAPVGLLHHFPVGRIVGIGNQVTGRFPPLRVSGRISPGGALVLFLALQESEEEGGLVELPPLLWVAQEFGKKFLCPVSFEKMCLVWRLFVAVAGGDCHPLDPQFREEVEAGMLGVNVGVPAPMAFFPFSGWKDSFYGDLHTNGKDGVEFYTKKKMMTSRYF